jgi:PAS domain S-box-containing protein
VRQKIRVGFVGVGKGGANLYRKLRTMELVEISIVCDISENAPGMIMAEYDGIRTTNTIEELCTMDLDVIIETTGNAEVQNAIEQLKSPMTSVLASKGAHLLMGFSEEKEKLYERKRLKGELEALFELVQEGIEVAGKDGTIQYVNPAFSRISGILAHERIGKNIFEVSPYGALARVLRTHEPLFAYRAMVGGTNVEVVSNASPIILDGKIDSAVVVFQPLTDIYKVMEQLESSTRMIKELESRINQISTSLFTFDDILGSHPDYQLVINKARRAAKMNASILIQGEIGTGKEILAHAIHSASGRKKKPFIKIHCAAIPESLIESELFGYESGVNEMSDMKLGKLELARGGTLFLDEVGELNLNLQAKLVRVLRDMEFKRVGGEQTIKADVRIISATNRNLHEQIKLGEFHEDLFEQLNGVELQLPPLRKHKEDVLAYARTFILKSNRKLRKHVIGMTKQAEQMLLDYQWPGNIKELKNVIERAIESVEEEMIQEKHLVNWIRVSPIMEEVNCYEPMSLDELEKKMIRLALQRYGDSVEGKKQAAHVLNISLATLYNKLKTL